MKKLLKKINPCDESHTEDSKVWLIMNHLFPECWCCAGIRGVVYGFLIASLFFTLRGCV
jgi:hypothetical protein